MRIGFFFEFGFWGDIMGNLLVGNGKGVEGLVGFFFFREFVRFRGDVFDFF